MGLSEREDLGIYKGFFVAVLAVKPVVFTSCLLGVGGDWVNKPEVFHQRDDSWVLRSKGDVPGSDQQVSPPVPLLDYSFYNVPFPPFLKPSVLLILYSDIVNGAFISWMLYSITAQSPYIFSFSCFKILKVKIMSQVYHMTPQRLIHICVIKLYKCQKGQLANGSAVHNFYSCSKPSWHPSFLQLWWDMPSWGLKRQIMERLLKVYAVQ